MFKFADLSAEAKATAIDANRYALVDDNYWCECTLADFKASLESKGFRDVEINFSGFSSQGDGASFTSDYIDVEEFLRSQGCYSKFRRYVSENKYNEISYDLKISRDNGCRYSHENSVYVDDSWNHWTTDNQENKIKEIIEMIAEFVEYESIEIYNALEKDYDANTEDQAVADFLESNDYDFTEDGEMI